MEETATEQQTKSELKLYGQIQRLKEKLSKFESLEYRLRRAKEDAQRRATIKKLERLLKAENARQEQLAIIRDCTVQVEPPKYEPFALAPSSAPVHTSALVTSDWQMGQWSKLGGSGGMYQQTTAITKRQVYQMWQKFLLCHTIDAAAKQYDEFVLWNLGDMCEGDQMRQSQAAEVDSLVTSQTLEVFDLEAMLITEALKHFKKVRVLRVGGNHDRTSSKPGNAGLGELGFTDTYSWMVGEFLKRFFAKSQDADRLEIVNHESFFGTAKVAGLRCVYEHGASFKTSTGSYGGVPYYPIANAARGYQSMLDGADVVLFGHHHKSMILPMNGGWGWQILNGALPPSSSWVQSSFKGYGRPTQWMLEFHHEIGLNNFRPIFLEQPEHMKPGQYWKKRHAA